MGVMDWLVRDNTGARLGSLLPERAAALQTASAAGSTGLGMTPTAPQPETAAMPQPPAAAPRQPLGRNPLESIGLGLQEAVAGFRGQPSPIDAARRTQIEGQRAQMEQQQMQARAGEIGLEYMQKYLPILAKAKPEDRPEIIKHAAETSKGALMGFDLTGPLTAWSNGDVAEGVAVAQALKANGADGATIALAATDREFGKAYLNAFNKQKAEDTAKGPEAPRSRTFVNAKGQEQTQDWDKTANGGQGGWKDVAAGTKAPSQNINIETANAPPPDYRYVRDANGRVSSMEVIPGSKTAKAEAAAATKQTADQATKTMQTNIVSQDIDRALDLMDKSTIPVTGIFGAVGSRVPGSAASDLSGLLDGIKANISFDKLQEMRRNSPTGGALGNISDNDMKLLQSVYGNLEQAKSQDMLRFNLQRLRDTVNLVVNGTVTPVAKGAKQSLFDEADAILKGKK